MPWALRIAILGSLTWILSSWYRLPISTSRPRRTFLCRYWHLAFIDLLQPGWPCFDSWKFWGRILPFQPYLSCCPGRTFSHVDIGWQLFQLVLPPPPPTYPSLGRIFRTNFLRLASKKKYMFLDLWATEFLEVLWRHGMRLPPPNFLIEKNLGWVQKFAF